MTLGTAVVLLVLAVAGIVAAAVGLKQRRTLRVICIVLFSLAALVLAAYIGLNVIFLDAASHKPPAL